MSLHLGVTLGLIGSAVVTVQEYRTGGMHDVVRSWSGWDWNYPDAWFPKTIVAPIPLVIGSVATVAAVKTKLNKYTPKGVNI